MAIVNNPFLKNTIQVVPFNDLVARDEEIEVDARKQFYANLEVGKEKREKWRRNCKNDTRCIIFIKDLFIFQPRYSCQL